jgi:DNA polymerase-3 subunit epsilon
MRNFLFLETETTGLNTGKDRIVQLSTRLVCPTESQDHNQLIRPDNFVIPATATKIHGITNQVATVEGISIAQALDDLSLHIQQADIIVGHHIEFDIAIIVAEARRNGNHDLVVTLTHPKFGLDGGRRAAICTKRLAADYLRSLGESPSRSDTKLAAIYRRLFGEELIGAHDALVDAIASQRVYNFLSAFQLEQGVVFLSNIVCFED